MRKQLPRTLPDSWANANSTQPISRRVPFAGTDGAAHAYAHRGHNRYARAPTESGRTPPANLDTRTDFCPAGDA